MVPTEQVAIILELAGRWYTSHLLLFIGMMLFIPGLLALGALAEAQARRRVCSILRDATHAAAIPRG